MTSSTGFTLINEQDLIGEGVVNFKDYLELCCVCHQPLVMCVTHPSKYRGNSCTINTSSYIQRAKAIMKISRYYVQMMQQIVTIVWY